MARKAEIGIDYYPQNTDHVLHRKVKLLFSDFNADGYWIYECIKCEIYKDRGYFMDTTNIDSLTLFAQDVCKKDLELVRNVISATVKRELFDKNIYDQFGVLTSDRIQENYLAATHRNKNPRLFVQEYVLIDLIKYENISVVDINGQSVNIYLKNVNILPLNADSGTQNKRKEKENKRKEKENENKIKGEGEYILPPELFEKLFKYLKKNTAKYYPSEKSRAESEMIDWQRKNAITQEKLDSDAELAKKNSEHIEWLFKKHLGRDMTLQIENCYTHYAARSFLIDGNPIVAWIPVLSGWMNKRDQFKKKTA